MKRNLIFTLIAALFVAAATFSSASANGDLDQVLNNMQRAAQGIRTISARLTQEKRNTQIGGKEVYKGNLFFKHKGKNSDMVLIRYDNGQRVSVIGDTITLFQPSINQVFITSRKAQGNKNQEFAFFADPYSLSPAQIKARYNIAYVGDDQGAAVLELTPKSGSAVRRMKWWVDKSSWLPVKSEVVERNGDVSTFALAELRTNGAIGDKTFKIDYGNAKVVRQ